ncbi:[formate-C-acetyltransferase]-activating enzyme [Alkalibaculum sp. M08DMB]|uniref:[formate-C-acetyltransferase]-activating enzyme n=1 Tax=Alkalibaculum sporogenes TaxID=2655001 RepID=A0A6A7K896_9FIRM|nr:[formate-C-acetyltransferase]-activating enzyme [Alkalibaculum sporogenes]MPW25670.1 [formate-C-acetyltransferase]-activating enzyme [Alkalibaculum sporogenes]
MKKAMIFNIQRYSIHDGEGIRTIVFFKGCSLRCPWCSNPESQSTNKEIMRKEVLCINCSSKNIFDCKQSPEFCPTNALEWVGNEMTVDQLVEEVMKDHIFYNSSGGGVTLSGGEVLVQGEFAIEFLKKLKSLGIHTAIETTGHGNWNILDDMSDYLDEVLFDLKIMDNQRFKEVIKGDGKLIKDNFIKLVNKGVKVTPRIPLIPTFTMDKDNINSIIEFLETNKINEVHLLPFHQYGSSKYKSIGKEYTLQKLEPSSKEQINRIKDIFISKGFTVTVGG